MSTISLSHISAIKMNIKMGKKSLRRRSLRLRCVDSLHIFSFVIFLWLHFSFYFGFFPVSKSVVKFRHCTNCMVH